MISYLKNVLQKSRGNVILIEPCWFTLFLPFVHSLTNNLLRRDFNWHGMVLAFRKAAALKSQEDQKKFLPIDYDAPPPPAPADAKWTDSIVARVWIKYPYFTVQHWCLLLFFNSSYFTVGCVVVRITGINSHSDIMMVWTDWYWSSSLGVRSNFCPWRLLAFWQVILHNLCPELALFAILFIINPRQWIIDWVSWVAFYLSL